MFMATKCILKVKCWEQKDGYYVEEGHTQTSECYVTLDEAKSICLAAGDCKAVATQSNVCSGQYRVTHGGPTFIYLATWASWNLRSYEAVECTAAGLGLYLLSVHSYFLNLG